MSDHTMTTEVRPADPPSTWSMLIGQVRYQLLMFRRTPVALFFTLGLPLVMLLVFGSVFGGETMERGGGDFKLTQFYVGGLAAFTAVSATFTNLANTIPIRRDEGILKRWRSTPLPAPICVAGFVISSVIIAAIGAALMIIVGAILYDVRLEADKVPLLIVAFLVGVTAFALMGIAVASLIRNAESAPAVANALILPLGFVSNVFIPIENPSAVLRFFSNWFPLGPFARDMQNVFDPGVDAPGFDVGHLAVVAAWGVLGAVLAVKFFRWEPHHGATPGRRRRRRGAAVGMVEGAEVEAANAA